MSLCKNCKNARLVWSSKLHTQNYIGCVLLLKEELTNNDILENIKAEEIATGWITSVLYTEKLTDNEARAMYNNQLIVRNVYKCKYFVD